ncbi:mechanosensitive ion channel MscS [Thermincola ferriacetica]|uniref:Mechanosensitive ion channel MscS n=1 Tax=Thermincola ferriacetica TaxID=281456 RepID=A0A0L6W3Q1_9FIRM|nr:mechanosensitive ion channel family protein [Thermincola ferriacetica]KNZ69724.1 mechanosensitive ion channel MscS [Thermincola ferriacetica]
MDKLIERWLQKIPLISEETLAKVFTVTYKIIGIIVIAKIGLMLGNFIINKVFTFGDRRPYFDERRVNTLRTLLKSALRYAAYFLVGLGVLQELLQTLLGTDIKTFLAGAGIIGVALGFGAQSLVKDIVTGFFILLENQYAVGEYITTGQYSGFVEEMGLRVTKLRDWGGELHIVPNGMLTAVTNYSRGSMRAMVDMSIAYEEDIDKAIHVMSRVAGEIAEELQDVIVEGPEILGVVAFGPSEVIIRCVAKTKPMEQWRVERELRKRFKEAFDKEGIEIPYPKQVYISGDKRTEAPKAKEGNY